MTRIVMAGASGAIGRLVLARLLARADVTAVHVIGRRALSLNHERLHQHVMPLEALDAFQPDFQVDAACNCLGTTIKAAGSQAAFRAVDQDAVLAFARLAQRAGARRFVSVSAIGASPRAATFYSRVKGEVEASLSGMGFSALDLLQPSLLLGDRDEFRAGERAAQLLSVPFGPLMRGPLSPWRPIETRVVAMAAVASLCRDLPGLRRHAWTSLQALAARV